MYYDSGGVRFRPTDDLAHPELLVQHHHGVNASCNYSTPFQAGRGVTQGGLLSAKLFNILVDVVAREWFWQLREDCNYKEAELDDLMATFFAIFYVNNAYLDLRDAEFLKHSLDFIVELFAWVGLQTNTKKTQKMIWCTPGRVCTQLFFESYRRTQRGQVSASE